MCVICFIFLAAPFYAFQTFPGKAQLFPRFFFFFFPFVLSAVIDMSDPWMYPEHREVQYVFCIMPTVSFYLLITLFWLFYGVHKVDVLYSFYYVYDKPTLIFENHIILKLTFHQIYSKKSGSKAHNYLRKRLNSIPTNLNIGPRPVF